MWWDPFTHRLITRMVWLTERTVLSLQAALFAATEATIISVEKSSGDSGRQGKVRDAMIGLCYFGLILDATAAFTSFALIDMLGNLPFKEAYPASPQSDLSVKTEAAEQSPSPLNGTDKPKSGRILLGRYGASGFKWNLLEIQCKVHYSCTYCRIRH